VSLARHSSRPSTAKTSNIPGEVVRFPSSVDGRQLKVPQIGWNRVRQTQPDPLFAGVRGDRGEGLASGKWAANILATSHAHEPAAS